MDGLTGTARIRELERAHGDNAHLPIIALTAHAMKSDQECFLAAGMDAYLSKPIRPQELDEILAAQLAWPVDSSSALLPSDVPSAPH